MGCFRFFGAGCALFVLFACSAREVSHRELVRSVSTETLIGSRTVPLPAVVYQDVLQVRSAAAARYPAIRGMESPTNQGDRVRPNPIPYVELFLVTYPRESCGVDFSSLSVEVDGARRHVYAPTEFRKRFPSLRYDTEGWSLLMEPAAGRCWVATDPWPMGARKAVWSAVLNHPADTNVTLRVYWTNELRWKRTKVEMTSGGL